jgi:hypothetical protein
MTLVVSDISHLGVVMVGDSAVTRQAGHLPPEVVPDAVKVQYSATVNVGVAMWGYANVGHQRLDHWIAEFLQNSVQPNDGVEAIGRRLADQLNPILAETGRPWKDLVCGFHVAGYRGELPCLFHVHCGHYNEPAHELRLHKDFPDVQKWSERHFKFMLRFGFIHLRNGYHPLFGPLFDQVLKYSKTLRADFDISFPHRTLQGRLEFYKLLVKFVTGVLAASGEHQGVSEPLSAIAFNENGLVINEQLELSEPDQQVRTNLTHYFLDNRGNDI